MASRDIADLEFDTNILAFNFIKVADEDNFPVLIYCTYRSPEEQARLYRNGRHMGQILDKKDQLVRFGRDDLAKILLDVGPQYGKTRVTNAGPGQSLHNYGMAFDGVPLRDGKPVWGTRTPEDKAIWSKYGDIAEAVGLDWSGRWTRFREFPHCQKPGQDWRKLIKK